MNRVAIAAAIAMAVLASAGTCEPLATANTPMTADAHTPDPFPIIGVHLAGCDVCHGASASFSEFDCNACHTHEQAQMDIAHQVTFGYVYQNAACYNCHPDGKRPF